MSSHLFDAQQHGQGYQEHPALGLRYLPHDPRSIVVFISGDSNYTRPKRRQTAAFGVFFGPGSFRNFASYVPLMYTPSQETAELFAVSATLQAVMEIVVTKQLSLPISRVVICTCSPELQMAMVYPAWRSYRAWLWRRTQGHRVLLRDVLARLRQLEQTGMEILFNWIPMHQTWESYWIMPKIH